MVSWGVEGWGKTEREKNKIGVSYGKAREQMVHWLGSLCCVPE